MSGPGDFNITVEDSRNIVEVTEESPNSVTVTTPGLGGNGMMLFYSEGPPWEVIIEL